jgi:hypothetical protein
LRMYVFMRTRSLRRVEPCAQSRTWREVASIEAGARIACGKTPLKIVLIPQSMHGADIEFMPARSAITL